VDLHAGIAAFAATLQGWYSHCRRDLPWRRTRDPYRIWVSEIMLQQTRAEVVIAYYERFLERFPDLEALAQASEQEVVTVWSGLGYYSRARNLHRAATQLASAHRFPQDFDSIRLLPGVGDYTAAAVASIAFELPRAVLDGNVMRVIARLENDAGDIGSAKTRVRLHRVAQELLDEKNPGQFNQAMMELGATVCLPRAPRCLLCPVVSFCRAYQAGTARELPIKLRRPAGRRVEETLVVIRRPGRILLWQRAPNESRMAGFWELPTVEQIPGIRVGVTLGSFRHTITNNRYSFQVVAGKLSKKPASFRWVEIDRLPEIPLSTTAKKALRFVELVIVL
jgi:A/G-specific adenine glycosylase